MTELSRLRGSEGYAVRADEAQGSERSFRQQPQALAGNGDERTLRKITPRLQIESPRLSI